MIKKEEEKFNHLSCECAKFLNDISINSAWVIVWARTYMGLVQYSDGKNENNTIN